MKRIATAAFAIILMMLATQKTMAQKLKVSPKIYAYGFSASFNDSVVYITDIQEIDSVWVTSRYGFLVNRDNYSNQLREFLAEKRHEENRTCIITFAFKRKDIEKKYIKLKQRYTKKGDFDVKFLTAADFLFTRDEFNPTEDELNGDEKKEEKLAKKAKKKELKEKKKAEKMAKKAKKAKKKGEKAK